MFYRMANFFKISFSESTFLDFLLFSDFLLLDFSDSIVARHIAAEIERVNNMQFLRYVSPYDYEVY